MAFTKNTDSFNSETRTSRSDLPAQAKTTFPANLPRRLRHGMQHLKSQTRAKIKYLIKEITLGHLFPSHYKRCCTSPIIPGRVVFFDAKGSTMPKSFELIYKRIVADPTKSVVVLNLEQNHAQFLKYYRNNCNALKELARAEVIYLDDASDLISCLPLRPETRVIQLWHACGAFKKWGMSTADKIFGGSYAELKKHPFYKNLSLVTVSSPEVIWAYAEAMDLGNQKEIIQPTGVSRTDIFFDQEFISSARAQLNTQFPPAHDKKIILYAPTFRGSVKKATGPDALDIPAMMNALGRDYVLVIKHHPYVKKPPKIPGECNSFAHLATDNLTIEQLLCTADICISDYSSVVFEYSLFSRPMIFFAYDLANYDDWRGFFYTYDEFTPGPIAASTFEIITHIQAFERNFDDSQIQTFRKKFMSACDGHATDRILDISFPDENSAQSRSERSKSSPNKN